MFTLLQEQQTERLTRSKSKLKRQNCIHEITYEKWIHEGLVQGKTYHYKEVCNKCGYRRCVPRTKDIYEAVKNQQWHSKKK